MSPADATWFAVMTLTSPFALYGAFQLGKDSVSWQRQRRQRKTTTRPAATEEP